MTVSEKSTNFKLKVPKFSGQSLLLVGKAGFHKAELAGNIASELLGINIDNSADSGSVIIIKPIEKNAITIEQIRQIDHFFSLSAGRLNNSESTQPFRRAVIIIDADKMSVEAQNSLLKNLEEPPDDVFFILTTSKTSNLLPTIKSRVQTITVEGLSKSAAEARITEFNNKFNKNEVERIVNIAAGSHGRLETILNQPKEQLFLASDEAKQILYASKYEQLIMIDRLSKNVEYLNEVLEVIIQIAEYSIATKSDDIPRWRTILSEATEAKSSLQSNVQTKLLLTRFMTSI